MEKGEEEIEGEMEERGEETGDLPQVVLLVVRYNGDQVVAPLEVQKVHMEAVMTGVEEKEEQVDVAIVLITITTDPTMIEETTEIITKTTPTILIQMKTDGSGAKPYPSTSSNREKVILPTKNRYPAQLSRNY